MNPNLALAHWGLGHAYYYAGRLDEAIRQFDRFAQLSPHDPNLSTVEANKAAALIAMRKYREALEVVEVAVKRPGSGLWAHLVLAMALGHLAMDDDARRAYAKAQDIKPDISLSFLRTSMRHTNPDQAEHLMSGLGKAGLEVPETAD